MKKVLALLTALALCFSAAPMASAADDAALDAANILHDLGLFSGVGVRDDGTPEYDLDRTLTRYEAVTMLVRLLGMEGEAVSGNWALPFTDVADWAKPYVGCAYASGLTSGMDAVTFSGEDTVSAAQYLTFVLRALNYQSGTDFQWDQAWELTDALGITDGRYNAQSDAFLRSDAALVSVHALRANINGEDRALIDKVGQLGSQITWIGDSYTFLSEQSYRLVSGKFPGVDIQSMSGKSFCVDSPGGVGGRSGITILREMVSYGRPIRKYLVFALGSNDIDMVRGGVNYIDVLMDLAGPDRIVILVTPLTCALTYEKVCTQFYEAAEKYPNIRIADWAAVVDGNLDTYFDRWVDLRHPNKAGYDLWLDLIHEALLDGIGLG